MPAEDSDAAFSASSASRCTTSLTAGPETEMPGCALSETRSYSSISDTAALITSASATGWLHSPGQLMTGQHQQVLRVAAHPGRDVVHLEQAGQPLGVLLPLLELVDQPELALHQGLAAAGQLHEHLAELAPQSGLVAGHPQHFGLHLVEGARDLADLVGGGDADRTDGERAAPAGPRARRAAGPRPARPPRSAAGQAAAAPT